jgi:hypothetical protein
MKPADPVPVKLLCGVLYSEEALLQKAIDLLVQRYGPVDYKSPLFPFDITDYYQPEMGATIWRLFVSFTLPVNPGSLARIKVECNEIEDMLAVDDQRKVNLDPGYMDYDKVVLASAKYNAHKIYLDLGIYADLTLRYEKGKYIPSPYAFPDFKNGAYEPVFLHIRAKYKGQLRKLMAGRRGEEISSRL